MPLLAWLLFCAVLCLGVVGNAVMNVSVDYVSFLPSLSVVGMTTLLFCVGLWDRTGRSRNVYQLFLLFFISHVAAGLLHYSTTAFAMPLVDQQLIAVDRALGFYGIAFVHWVNDHPTIAGILNAAYYSFFTQAFIAMLGLAVIGKAERMFTFFSAYLLATLISNAIYVFTPAESAYVVFNLTAESVPHINTHSAFEFLEHFNALRNGTMATLVFPDISGMMTFPSMHAGVALLYAWVMRPVPILGVMFVAINVLMAISAISHGSHYAIDIIAGLAVAAFALLAVKRIELRMQNAKMPTAQKQPALAPA
jgi:membrane-associated phospholipid phosphatase